MGAVISALLVGRSLASALFVWLPWGDSGDQDAEMEEPRAVTLQVQRGKRRIVLLKTLSVIRRAALENSTVEHEDWEMTPTHSVWRDASKGKSSEPSHVGVPVLEFWTSSPYQGLDYGRDSLKDAQGQEVHLKTKMAAVSSLYQQVSIQFKVHCITMSDAAVVAVTGGHERLGSWHNYIPLQYGKNLFWSRFVPLPVDTALKWKFVIVENGSIVHWEECSNRLLETGKEDMVIHKCCGCH
ncbi:starch-binding domain-containing protein 1-like [Sarcophilus harrisii]